MIMAIRVYIFYSYRRYKYLYIRICVFVNLCVYLYIYIHILCFFIQARTFGQSSVSFVSEEAKLSLLPLEQHLKESESEYSSGDSALRALIAH